MTDEKIVLPTMTLEQAIASCSVAAEHLDETMNPHLARAVQLGREALIRLQAMKAQHRDFFDWAPLPGETLEET